MFDQSRFELAHEVFAGNKNDSTTLVEMIEKLMLPQVTVVACLHEAYKSRRPRKAGSLTVVSRPRDGQVKLDPCYQSSLS